MSNTDSRTTPDLGATSARTGRTRRLTALLVGLALTVAGLTMSATPAGAAAPGAPTALLARGYHNQIRVYWAPPTDDGGADVTSYRIERFVVGNPALDAFWVRPNSSVLFDAGAVLGVDYRYRVRAYNDDGSSPWSGWMQSSKALNFTEYSEFGGSKPAFVTRQFQDFLGRNPGFGELNTFLLELNNGGLTPGEVIENLAGRSERVGARHPVIRLYAAYFDRAPDHGGLGYWASQRKAGNKTLDDVSSSFAGSNEFNTTYGALTNAEFVTLVYQNVLDRDPEPTGFAYWTDRLDSGSATRGRVMTQFSESNEFKVNSNGTVWAADVYDAMIGTDIPAVFGGHWSRHLDGGGTVGHFANRLMLLASY